MFKWSPPCFTGKTVARLNGLKAELSRVVERCSTLGRDIADKEAALERFEEEFKHAQKERDAAKAALRKLKLEQEDV